MKIFRRPALLILTVILLASCKKEVTEQTAQTLAATSYLNVPYGNDWSQIMDVYLPKGRTEDSTKLLILVHGGAWYEGDKADFASYIPPLQQRLPGYAIANVNYRLATANRNAFPAQEMDVKSSVDFLLKQSPSYHISKNFILMGASAGGHLVLLQAYKYHDPQIKAVIDFFGPTDITALYNSIGSASDQQAFQVLMSGTPSSNPELYQQSSPINFVNSQSPPTIIFHGGKDKLVNIAESEALKKKLDSAGVINQMIVYPDEGHGWTGATLNDSFDKIQAFLNKNVK